MINITQLVVQSDYNKWSKQAKPLSITSRLGLISHQFVLIRHIENIILLSQILCRMISKTY